MKKRMEVRGIYSKISIFQAIFVTDPTKAYLDSSSMIKQVRFDYFLISHLLINLKSLVTVFHPVISQILIL